MSKRILALWHTNEKTLEVNQKVLDYCSCNKKRKVRQHKVTGFCQINTAYKPSVKNYIFVQCCNCGLESVNESTEKYIKRVYTKEYFDSIYYFEEVLKRYIHTSHRAILKEYKAVLLD